MKWYRFLIIRLLGGNLAIAHVKVMEDVDLDRYVGTWYEIALLPNRFEKKCVCGAIAEYKPLKQGMLLVTNQCKKKKRESAISGVAWRVDPSHAGKLKVSFAPLARFFKWFGGDYWILYVDPDYQFAVVGTPSHKYLWLLSRKPFVSEEVYQTFLTVASKNGFDTAKIRRVR